MIELCNVSKKYGRKTILDNISAKFTRGQTVSFIGHNGCGKSTLLKIIAGLTAPSGGRVAFQEALVFHYVPEKFVPVSMTAQNYLIHMGRMDGLERHQRNERIQQLSTDFFVKDLLHIPMKYLSKGTLQKIGVIQALLKIPDVLILDEPLSGQDIESQEVFIRKMQDLIESGVSVFVSCHEQRLVHALDGDVYTIDKGKLMPACLTESKNYTIILENSLGKHILEGMKPCGEYYRMVVSQEVCDQQLPQLLQEGWKLRGLRDEKNN